MVLPEILLLLVAPHLRLLLLGVQQLDVHVLLAVGGAHAARGGAHTRDVAVLLDVLVDAVGAAALVEQLGASQGAAHGPDDAGDGGFLDGRGLAGLLDRRREEGGL